MTLTSSWWRRRGCIYRVIRRTSLNWLLWATTSDSFHLSNLRLVQLLLLWGGGGGTKNTTPHSLPKAQLLNLFHFIQSRPWSSIFLVTICLFQLYVSTGLPPTGKINSATPRFLMNSKTYPCRSDVVVLGDFSFHYEDTSNSEVNNNNVHLSCAHQCPERSHDTY